MKTMDLANILRETISDVVGEYRDDKKLTAAEVVEVTGQLINRLDEAGVLPRPGDILLKAAIAMGEDGV